MYFVQFAMILLVTTSCQRFSIHLNSLYGIKQLHIVLLNAPFSFQVNEGVAMDTYMIKDPYKNDFFTDRNNAIIYLNYL
jgi:hypothetical protein